MKPIKLALAALAATLVLAALGCAGGPLPNAVKNDISRQMVAKRSALSTCYRAALKRNATVQGRMTLNFTVAPSGAFSAVTIADSAVRDAKLSSCVENATQGMRLSVRPPSRPVMVTYPVMFTPASIP